MNSIESDIENSDKIYLCKTSSMNKQFSNIIYMLDCQHIRLKGTSAPPSQTKYSIACVHIRLLSQRTCTFGIWYSMVVPTPHRFWVKECSCLIVKSTSVEFNSSSVDFHTTFVLFEFVWSHLVKCLMCF